MASALLGVGSPLWLSIAVAVRVSSRGPALHRSLRVGLHGHQFELLKFRTMRVCNDGPAVTMSGDDRVTSIGRILRATKLDEVPQLVNVVRAEMALVGPRPEDPRYVANYNDEQLKILQARPGLTSPASIHYRHEEELLAAAEDLERCYLEEVLPHKLRIDVTWLSNRTALGDLTIIASTLRAIPTRRRRR